MKTTRAFIAALVLGCLCSIVSADVAAHKADTSPAAHSDPTPPHPHPKAPAAPAAHDQTVATAAAVAVASSPKSPSTPSTTAPPVCGNDKSNSAFFKKNTVTFAIGGGCIVVAFFICFFGVICSRRRKRLQKLKERKLEDSYQMSETNDRRDLYRKSNIRIGLDPSDNGMVDVMMPYDGSQGSSLTRRPSAGAVSAKARAGGRSNGSYPPDALMTEHEMALDLESDTNQRMGSSLSNWPAPPGSRERTGYFDTPPPTHPLPALNTAGGSKGKGMLQKSPSVGNHIVYVPPPLPPPAITTPTSSKLTGGISPYADEAMIVFPPESPPRPVNNGNGLKNPSFQQAPAIRIGEVASSQGPRGLSAPYDEPSFLDLNNNNNSLTVDRYRTDGKSSPAKDRTSVNSFFSGLALDEPTPESYSLPPILPEPSFASEEYVMPAPIARVIPVPTPRGASPSSPSLTTVTLPPPSSSSSTKPKSAYERQQEEIQVASCFAQDLGFEIVHPSPTGSPRHKAATPTGSRRL
ncbi:hypothetical protein BGX24_007366 [Mortierella sp. AD032]|nr:hypothetical protein BGX24_007366 [Mortierella sp. AD032]